MRQYGVHASEPPLLLLYLSFPQRLIDQKSREGWIDSLAYVTFGEHVKPRTHVLKVGTQQRAQRISALAGDVPLLIHTFYPISSSPTRTWASGSSSPGCSASIRPTGVGASPSSTAYSPRRARGTFSIGLMLVVVVAVVVVVVFWCGAKVPCSFSRCRCESQRPHTTSLPPLTPRK